MKIFFALVLLLALPGCASMRGTSIGSDETIYRIQVTNQTGRTMTVAWSDGTTTRTLGDVSAGRSEQFVIAGAKSTSVSIRGTASNGTTSGPYTVSLISGETQRVTLR